MAFDVTHCEIERTFPYGTIPHRCLAHAVLEFSGPRPIRPLAESLAVELERKISSAVEVKGDTFSSDTTVYQFTSREQSVGGYIECRGPESDQAHVFVAANPFFDASDFLEDYVARFVRVREE